MRAPLPDYSKGGSMVDGVETYTASAATEGRERGEEENLKTLGGGKFIGNN